MILCAVNGETLNPGTLKKQVVTLVAGSVKEGIDKKFKVDGTTLLTALKASEEPEFKELHENIQQYWQRRDPEFGTTIQEEPEVFVSSKNYFRTKRDLKRFLILEIERYAIQIGSIMQLGIELGHEDKYAQKALQRGRLSGLEKIWKECVEILGE